MTPAQERWVKRVEWAFNPVAALKAALAGDHDARSWLQATGLDPEPECTCPRCQPPEPA